MVCLEKNESPYTKMLTSDNGIWGRVYFPFFVFFYIKNISALISYFSWFEKNVIKNYELKILVDHSIYYTSNLQPYN